MKKHSIYRVLHVNQKLYKLDAKYKHPYISAFKNMCRVTGMLEPIKSGKIDVLEAVTLRSKYIEIKDSYPSKNRRYTQAQLYVLQRLDRFVAICLF